MVIHVRAITNAEGNRLRTIVRHPKDPIELRRAQVVLSSAQGFTPPYIARLVGMSVDYVRTLIHQFNSDGMDMLRPKWKPGGSYKFTDRQKEQLVELATSRPKDTGLPFAQWSLSRIRDEAVRRSIVESISLEWLRVILDEADVSRQSIKTWKESKDPEFDGGNAVLIFVIFAGDSVNYSSAYLTNFALLKMTKIETVFPKNQ